MINIVPLKRKLLDLYINNQGWRTDRKILVIESDDWGSIRMPSKQVYNELLSRGLPVDKLSYLKYDALESNSDLESLFEVLTSFKDKNGNHPVITANTIMTNPDFDKIRESKFSHYYYELFTETLKHYPEHDRVLELYKRGIKQKIFLPQLHGLEHLNVRRWIKSLQNDKSNIRSAFAYGLFDLSVSHTEITEDSFVDALNPENIEEILYEEQSLIKAADLFKLIFGYNAVSFVPPCYIWRPELEMILSKMGIKTIQSAIYQRVPKMGEINKFSKIIHYTGQRNRFRQTYTVRNCFFEPSSNNDDIIGTCLTEIDRAFRNNKPAIISSHRVNFCGSINEFNRTKNLNMLKELLKKVIKTWPDIGFFSSEKLAYMLDDDRR